MDNNIIDNAIEYFEKLRKMLCDDYLQRTPEDSIGYKVTMIERKYFDIAINTLKQGNAIGEIRSELEANIKYLNEGSYFRDGLEAALDVVNKFSRLEGR